MSSSSAWLVGRRRGGLVLVDRLGDGFGHGLLLGDLFDGLGGEHLVLGFVLGFVVDLGLRLGLAA